MEPVNYRRSVDKYEKGKKIQSGTPSESDRGDPQVGLDAETAFRNVLEDIISFGCCDRGPGGETILSILVEMFDALTTTQAQNILSSFQWSIPIRIQSSQEKGSCQNWKTPSSGDISAWSEELNNQRYLRDIRDYRAQILLYYLKAKWLMNRQEDEIASNASSRGINRDQVSVQEPSSYNKCSESIEKLLRESYVFNQLRNARQPDFSKWCSEFMADYEVELQRSRSGSGLESAGSDGFKHSVLQTHGGEPWNTILKRSDQMRTDLREQNIVILKFFENCCKSEGGSIDQFQAEYCPNETPDACIGRKRSSFNSQCKSEEQKNERILEQQKYPQTQIGTEIKQLGQTKDADTVEHVPGGAEMRAELLGQVEKMIQSAIEKLRDELGVKLNVVDQELRGRIQESLGMGIKLAKPGHLVSGLLASATTTGTLNSSPMTDGRIEALVPQDLTKV